MQRLLAAAAALCGAIVFASANAQTTKPPPPTGTLPITLTTLDAGGKVVGMWSEGGAIHARVNGTLTRIFAMPDPVYVTSLRVVEGPGLFFTSDDCSGMPYVAPNGAVGVRASSTLQDANGRWWLYIAQPSLSGGNPAVNVKSLIQDAQYGCRATDQTLYFQPTQPPIAVDSLFTEPYRLQPASTSTKPKDARNLPDYTTIVDSTNRIVGRLANWNTYITVNGFTTTLPVTSSPSNAEQLVVGDGFGLMFTTGDCSGQPYVFGHHDGVWGVQPSTVFLQSDGRRALYTANTLALSPIHYFSTMSVEGECSPGADDTKVGAPANAPILIDTLFTEPFHLQ
ncbi:MAG: hypothetical protein J7605_29520 [Variovorax sp.]|nr:hypothetical protein [Variovorax sp.]